MADLCVIINPQAGRGHAPHLVSTIRNAFSLRDASPDILLTRKPRDAVRLAKESTHHTVVVVGGDGTLHEVLQGLSLDTQALGLIPVGTGNDFAYFNRWPKSVDACVDRILQGVERRLDVGSWEGGRFHNSVGFGFEAYVNQKSKEIRMGRGPLLYLLALLKSLPKGRTWPTTLRWGANSWQGEVFSGALCIGPRVGGLFYIAPRADNQDGLLDTVISEKLGLWRFGRVLFNMLSKKLEPVPGVRRPQGSDFHIASLVPFPVYADGEFYGSHAQIHVQCLKGRLRSF